MKRSTIVLLLAISITFFIGGCTSGAKKVPFLLFRFLTVDPVAVMVLLPPNVTYSKSYDQFDSMYLKSKDIQVAFDSLEMELCEKYATTLQRNLPSIRIDSIIANSSIIKTFDFDPRKLEEKGFALFVPQESIESGDNLLVREFSGEKEENTKVPPVVDSSADFWLLETSRPFGNEKKQRFFSLDYRVLQKKAKARFLLLVSLDSISAIDRQVRTDVEFYFSTRIISLKNKSMPIELKKIERISIEPGIENAEQIILSLKSKIESAMETSAADFASRCSPPYE